MTARPLRSCPTCGRALDAEARAVLGLRGAVLLTDLCPGRCGPTDIDNVLHNGQARPQRVALIEYKPAGVLLSEGQGRLFRAVAGTWHNPETGQWLVIRYWLVWPADAGKLAEAVAWTWPAEG